MIFSILLTGAFLFMALYAFVFMAKRTLGKLLIALYAGAILIVWQPDIATRVAHFVGIGRGVDLGLMLMSVIALNVIVFLINHLYHLHKQITLLTRNIALNNAIISKSFKANKEDAAWVECA